MSIVLESLENYGNFMMASKMNNVPLMKPRLRYLEEAVLFPIKRPNMIAKRLQRNESPMSRIEDVGVKPALSPVVNSLRENERLIQTPSNKDNTLE
jgi:hypothetical protein